MYSKTNEINTVVCVQMRCNNGALFLIQTRERVLVTSNYDVWVCF